MPKQYEINGLVTAAFTPFDIGGEVDTDRIKPLVEFLLARNIDGFYVCGSTGEGVSLTTQERKLVAETYMNAVDGRKPVIIQVGHNSVKDAMDLAQHAQSIGANAVSATCPSYFKSLSIDTIVDIVDQIASAAKSLPFYYYHIPTVTGVDFSMVDFLHRAGSRIENLNGLKYTKATLNEFQACMELEDGRYDMLWGSDEMLLPAFVMGARGGIGSTYNIASPIYRQIIEAFSQSDFTLARSLQNRVNQLTEVIIKHSLLPSLRVVLELLDMPIGNCRLPLKTFTQNERSAFIGELEESGCMETVRELMPN